MTVDILLATYQSDRFLAAQLDSLFSQTCNDFRILVRDDGSSDHTVDIIDDYSRKFPGRIFMISGSHGGGVVNNFGELLRHSDSELTMFCDHDDVWMPNKIAKTLERYQQVVKECNKDTPILLFTDAIVTDIDLNEVDASSIKFQNLDPKRTALPQLLLQNVAAGNTILINRALRTMALPIPPEAVMHDHWITLVACLFGRIEFISEPTLYYRQHGENVYGATEFSLKTLWRKMQDGRSAVHNRLLLNVKQGAALYVRYEKHLTEKQRIILQEFSRLLIVNSIQRRWIVICHGIWKKGLIRNLCMLLWGL
jgi:glycosyltransferase involved in cell wall biosynthesis